MSSSRRGNEKKPIREAIQPWYDDARDRLAPVCPCGCGAPLTQAELDLTGSGGPTAHGTYACGAKFMAWADGPQRPVCIRLCERKVNAEQASVESVVVGDVGAPVRLKVTPEEFREFEALLSGLDPDEENHDT